MVLPEKLTTMKLEELREECHVRNIDSDGLSREQMIVVISQYEGKMKEETLPVPEDSKSDSLELRKLEIQLKLQEIKDKESERNHEFRMKQLEM